MAETRKNIDYQPLSPGERQHVQHRVEYLPLFFLLIALALFPHGTSTEAINSLALVFISIVLEAIPFMLVGSLVAGFIEVFVSRERMASLIPKKEWLAVFVAAGAGIIFPVCECAVVPVVRRLLGKGLPLSGAIAYLLAGPIVNPVVAASTALAYAFDWRIVALRLGLAYGIAVVVGLLTGILTAKVKPLLDNTSPTPGNGQLFFDVQPCQEQTLHGKSIPTLPLHAKQHSHAEDCACGCNTTVPFDHLIDKIGAVFVHAKNDFLAVAHFLVIGAFIAALAQTFISRADFLSFTETPILSVIIMMMLAILLNLCSEADAFIAASFQGLIPVPAQLAFLLTGPMFDLKLLLMYQTVFTRRTILILATLILSSIFIVTVGMFGLQEIVQ